MRERRDRTLLWRLLSVLLALSLVAAACGDDDDEEAGGTTTTGAGEEEPAAFVVPASCETDSTGGGGATDDTSTDDTSTDGTSTDDTATDDTSTDDTSTDDTAAGGDAAGAPGQVSARSQTDAVEPLVAPPHPQAGGTLIDNQNFGASDGDPAHIEPGQAYTLQGAQIAYLLFDGLTDIDYETGELKPSVAESWESNDDATEWTFKIREGVTFSDGEPVLPSNFKCAWERVVQPAFASALAYHLDVIDGKASVDEGDTTELSGVIADDENMTLTVKMASPYSEFPRAVQHAVFSPVPKGEISELGEDQSEWEQGVMTGNGPYKMAGPWEHGRVITLERNDQYWGGINNHLAALDRIEFRIAKDIESQYNEFEAGQADTAAIPPGRFAQATEQYPDATQAVAGIYYFGLGQDNPVVGGDDNKLLRHAISLAVDRQAINQAVYDGSRKMPTGVTPPAIPGFEEGLCGDLCPETPDVERAQQLLEQWGGEVTEPLQVQFNADAGHEPVADIIVENLAAVGIPAQPVPIPGTEYFDQMREPEQCEFCRAGWIWDWNSYDNALYALFHSSTIGGDNLVKYDNEEFDAKMDEARGTLDEAARHELYREAERILLDDMAVVPINWYNGAIVYHEKVQNFILSPLNLVAYDEVTLSS